MRHCIPAYLCILIAVSFPLAVAATTVSAGHRAAASRTRIRTAWAAHWQLTGPRHEPLCDSIHLVPLACGRQQGAPARTPISDRPLRRGAADAAAARADRSSPRSRRGKLCLTSPPHRVAHSAAVVRLCRRAVWTPANRRLSEPASYRFVAFDAERLKRP